MDHTIWTVGHSTRPLYEFVAMLHSFGVECVADIRSYPGSRRFPHFNREALAAALPQSGVQYIHIIELGGRRKPEPESKNTGWRHPAFRAYADYMETAGFKGGIEGLERIASERRTAIMCSEAVWWRCHRSMVSDALKLRGWRVMHIMGVGKAEEHPYTSPARIVNSELNYEKESGGA